MNLDNAIVIEDNKEVMNIEENTTEERRNNNMAIFNEEMVLNEEYQNVIDNCINDYNYAIERISIGLMSEDKLDLTIDFPYRKLGDLVVYYRLILSEDEEQFVSVRVTSKFMDEWGNTEDKLFEDAIRISENKNPLDYFDMAQMLGFPMVGMIPMYVATNNKKIRGASVILYNDFFSKIRETIGDTCYMLPSSIHEVILIPNGEDSEPDTLINIVRTINQDVVQESDRLSDNIYLVDAVDKKITIVNN